MANYVIVVENRPIMTVNIVSQFHSSTFLSKLTHPDHGDIVFQPARSTRFGRRSFRVRTNNLEQTFTGSAKHGHWETI